MPEGTELIKTNLQTYLDHFKQIKSITIYRSKFILFKLREKKQNNYLGIF